MKEIHGPLEFVVNKIDLSEVDELTADIHAARLNLFPTWNSLTRSKALLSPWPNSSKS